MKKVFLALLLGTFTAGNTFARDPDITRFAATKEAQVREWAGGSTNKIPAIVWSFFDAVRVDDYVTATNLGGRLDWAAGRYTNSDPDAISPVLRTLVWQPITETIGTYEEFHDLGANWSHRFVHEVIGSIPKGSIYFGGTDAGRFLISAFCESQRDGQPFFTLTQNQLIDGGYLNYLQKIYGNKIHLYSPNDVQEAMGNFYDDFQVRYRAGKLKQGEIGDTMADGRIQMSGRAVVMGINGLLAQKIVEKNPDREFYLEESDAIEWMYPNLSPYGLIMKLSTHPIDGLGQDLVEKDMAYWKKFVSELIGDWITTNTSNKEICDFIDKVYLKKDRAGFQGSLEFMDTEEAHEEFSKLRLAHANVYAWRAAHARDADEKARMQKAAELAYRQCYALCPQVPQPVKAYVQFLLPLGRVDECLLLAQTSLRLTADDSSARTELLGLIHTIRKAQ